MPVIPLKAWSPDASPRKPRHQRRSSQGAQARPCAPERAAFVSPEGGHPISQAILLDLLGQQPIAFHRVYVDLTGDVLAALWLSNALSKMASMGQHGTGVVDAQGVFLFRMTIPQCTEETGLTASQQQRCRRLLRDSGILTEHKAAARIVDYALHMPRLAERMREQSTELAEALQGAQVNNWLSSGQAHQDLDLDIGVDVDQTDLTTFELVPARRAG